MRTVTKSLNTEEGCIVKAFLCIDNRHARGGDAGSLPHKDGGDADEMSKHHTRHPKMAENHDGLSVITVADFIISRPVKRNIFNLCRENTSIPGFVR